MSKKVAEKSNDSLRMRRIANNVNQKLCRAPSGKMARR
jgi:hypothetical protein